MRVQGQLLLYLRWTVPRLSQSEFWISSPVYPRCLFGSASVGEMVILAGGCDLSGNTLSVAELYNSELGTWEALTNMNKTRKMCSAVFMMGIFT